jgi:hypothetical protein
MLIQIQAKQHSNHTNKIMAYSHAATLKNMHMFLAAKTLKENLLRETKN